MELSRPLSTVTPTLDGDVLALLARHETRFTTGQLHRILTRYSEEGIRRVLRRLTKEGSVRSDRVGNAFTYELNRDHLAAEHIIGLARLRETFLKHLEDRLQCWEASPIYAAVFGSAARGEMTAESDLDLLLIRPDSVGDGLWETQVNNLTADVTRWIGNDTRTLEFTQAEVAHRGRDEPVLRDVLNEGLTVAGTRAWLAEQLRMRKD
ncbi:MAG: nucleotidyltransferase domain-containing protein [Actinomycetota bacterium]|nr:nucleotidyltransferase domain-containing protein [Actinomycetota bacterium]